MARLVTKFKYIDGKSDKRVGGYAKYIATREGVEKIDDSKKYAPSTKNQQRLIEKILKDFPDSKDSFEYQDYKNNPTIENASEFIARAIEDNACYLQDSKTYADYIATRPRVEKFGTHGLFTDDGVEVNLSKVSDELNNYKGNVWTAIVSLRREDAEKLGFDTGARWRDMVRSNVQELSKNFKIPMSNIKWYGAFHNESHHPHIHLIIYSSTENEGYLSKQGVNNLRSALAKDIFAQDLLCTYEKQTEYRNKLKQISKEEIENIITQINNKTFENDTLKELLIKLSEKLSRTKGKKVYGYLKSDAKDIIDNIVNELEQQEYIKKLYDLWYEQREEVIKTYMENLPKRIPISQNKEFKSIKNLIIQEAMKITDYKMDKIIDDTGINYISKDTNNLIVDDDLLKENIDIDTGYYYSKDNNDNKTWWTDEYKKAREYLYGTKYIKKDFEKAYNLMKSESEKGNGFAMYDLGYMHMLGLGVEKNEDVSQEYFLKAYNLFLNEEKLAEKKGYLQYRIGKMFCFGYGVKQDYTQVVNWYTKAMFADNAFAMYSLGLLYYKGQGVEQSYTKAFEMFKMSAKHFEKPNAYAMYELGRMYKEGIGTETDIQKSEKWYSEAYQRFITMEENMADDKLYYRLGQMNMTGTGTAKNLNLAKYYFEKALELENTNALYGLGKLYLNKEFREYDIQKAIYYLELSAEKGNEYAKNLLEYMQSKKYKMVGISSISLINSLARLIQNRIEEDRKQNIIDRKLKRKINEKKQAHGLKQE